MARIKINSHFTYKTILLIALPTIISTFIWTASSFIDGVIVSNFISRDAFEAFSYCSAYTVVLFAFSYITAYAAFNMVSKSLGENKIEEADKRFFALAVTSLVLGLLITLVSILCLKPILTLIGASGHILDTAMEYGYYVCGAITLFTLSNFFRDCDYISEKRNRSLYLTIVTELIHIGLSSLFIIVFKMGIKGAAIATLITWGINTIYYIIYYSRKNSSLLRLRVGRINIKEIFNAFVVSVPSFICDLAGGIIALFISFLAYKYFVDGGVIANGATTALFTMIVNTGCGLTLAIMPVFSYNYGARNKEEIKSLFNKCIKLLLIIGVILLILIEALANPLAMLYADIGTDIYNLTVNAIRIGNITVIFTYINFFISSYLISLDDKKMAYISSLSRMVIFWPLFLFIMPLLTNNGYFIWCGLLFADIVCFMLNILLLYKSKLGLKRLD